MNFWLAKQRRLWRLDRLPRERQLLLQLAGLDMNIYHPLTWQRLAHEAATRVQAIHTQLVQALTGHLSMFHQCIDSSHSSS